MQRMRGADAGFLYSESERQPTTTPVLVVLRPEGTRAHPPRALTIDDLRTHVEARLDLLPSFRRRVERVPFGLHHPVLVDDPDFDLGYHLRHVTLDDPSEAGLTRFVEEQTRVRLDRRHPLWRLVLVDGLHEGRQGLLLLWSHALADGTACRTTLRRLLSDIDADELAAVRSAEPFRPAPIVRRRILVEAISALVRSVLLLPLLLWRFQQRTKAVEARRAEAPVVVPTQEDTPITRLNDAWSGERSAAQRTVPLADVLRVKAKAGVTVNDLFLALAAGAVRAHLDATGDLPAAPLTINIPVSTEPEWPAGEPERQWGNHFSNYLSSLATDVADPVERLRAISASAREGRLQLDILGPTALVGLLDNLPPLLAEPGARWMAADKREHGDERADYSVILSNMRGAAQPFRFTTAAGPVLVERTSVYGMVFDGTGLSLVGWTYADQVELSAVADAVAVPDPGPILDRMVAALAELEDALDASEHTGSGDTPSVGGASGGSASSGTASAGTASAGSASAGTASSVPAGDAADGEEVVGAPAQR